MRCASVCGNWLFLAHFHFLMRLMSASIREIGYLCFEWIIKFSDFTFFFLRCLSSRNSDVLQRNIVSLFHPKAGKKCFFFVSTIGVLFKLEVLIGPVVSLVHSENWEKICCFKIQYFHRFWTVVISRVCFYFSFSRARIFHQQTAIRSVILIYSIYTCYQAIIICVFATDDIGSGQQHDGMPSFLFRFQWTRRETK